MYRIWQIFQNRLSEAEITKFTSGRRADPETSPEVKDPVQPEPELKPGDVLKIRECSVVLEKIELRSDFNEFFSSRRSCWIFIFLALVSKLNSTLLLHLPRQIS